MKTLVASFLFITITTFSSAQTQQEPLHMEFMGVPIDGTLNSFVSKMKERGFISIGTENGVAMLRGDFASYKDCIVGVSTLKKKDLVSNVIVIFPESKTWESLSGNYFHLKELLTEKYGEPSETIEEFESTQPRDDNDKMHAVGMNRCIYHSVFKTENGSIKLSIANDSFVASYVALAYYDKANSETIRQEAIKDL